MCEPESFHQPPDYNITRQLSHHKTTVPLSSVEYFDLSNHAFTNLDINDRFFIACNYL